MAARRRRRQSYRGKAVTSSAGRPKSSYPARPPVIDKPAPDLQLGPTVVEPGPAVVDKPRPPPMPPSDGRKSPRPKRLRLLLVWVGLIAIAGATIWTSIRWTAQANSVPDITPVSEAFRLSPIDILVDKVGDSVQLTLRVDLATQQVLVDGMAIDKSGHRDTATKIALLIPVWNHPPLGGCLADLTTYTLKTISSSEGRISALRPPSLEVTPDGNPATSTEAGPCTFTGPPINPGITYIVVYLLPHYNETIKSNNAGEVLTRTIAFYGTTLAFDPSPVLGSSHGYTVIVPKIYVARQQGSIPTTYHAAIAASQIAPVGKQGWIRVEVDGALGDHLADSNPPANLQSETVGFGDVAQLNVDNTIDANDLLGQSYSPSRMDFSSDSLSRIAAENSLRGGIALGIGASLAASILFYLATQYTEYWKRSRT